MGALHAWAIVCGLLSALITFIATGGDRGDMVLAGIIAWVLTYIIGPAIVAIFD